MSDPAQSLLFLSQHELSLVVGFAVGAGWFIDRFVVRGGREKKVEPVDVRDRLDEVASQIASSIDSLERVVQLFMVEEKDVHPTIVRILIEVRERTDDVHDRLVAIQAAQSLQLLKKEPPA